MRRKDGGTEARTEFDRFVDEAADGLLRAAYLIAWDLAEAEDLVQECLFQVARRWPRVRKMEYPVAYARTVLVHLALDGGKRRTRRRSELSPAPGVLEDREDESAVRVIGRIEESADLMGALESLSPRQRVALVLRYFEDQSEAETASIMGCSVGTVKSTTSRALDRLREEIERPGVSLDGAQRPEPSTTNTASTTSTTSTTSTSAGSDGPATPGTGTTAHATHVSITGSKRSIAR